MFSATDRAGLAPRLEKRFHRPPSVASLCDVMEMDMKQLDLFFEPPQAPAAKRIDPDGAVCTADEIDETVTLGDYRYGLRIELAQHAGQWMWGTSFHTPTGGQGYRVGPKWGNFAGSICDAARNAIAEIRDCASRYEGGQKVIKLLEENLNLQVLGVAA